MRIEYRPNSEKNGWIHAYMIFFNLNTFWCFPSVTSPRSEPPVSALSTGIRSIPGKPPTEELKALIRAKAPEYMIIDKLIEEYEEWEEFFMSEYATEYT